MSSKQLPVFITETGWSSNSVSQDTQAQYYNQTFNTIWNDPNIVAITPFLLDAGAGPFEQFSFIDANGNKTKEYQYFYNMHKVKGVPSFPTRRVLGASTSALLSSPVVTKDFTGYKFPQPPFSLTHVTENVFDYLIGD